MNEWFKVVITLCTFGFLKELRPSEPYLYEYLNRFSWNITSEEVIQEVYPVSTYSHLAQLLIVFLIADLCWYKYVIVVLPLAGIVVWYMLIWGSTLLEAQISQAAYGTFMAIDGIYYIYISVKVPKKKYAQVTAYTTAATFAGRILSGTIAQALLEFTLFDYKMLNYITLVAMIIATLWGLLLPSVSKTVYFHQNPSISDPEALTSKHQNQAAFELMKTQLIQSYTNKYIIKWSIWWALITCGFIQVKMYIQPLWSEININSNSSLYNGLAETLIALTGFLGTLSIGFMKNIDWKQVGELVLSLCTILIGAVLMISSQAQYVLISYACYIVFGGLYYFLTTIISSEIAKQVPEDSYGLVFRLNTLIALVFQTIVTLCFVTGDIGWSLGPRDQHLMYGIFHIGVAVVFIISGIIDWLNNHADIYKTYN